MKKTATLGLRLDECTVDRLEELASEVGLKASTIARLAIERFIADARFRGSLSLPVTLHTEGETAEADDSTAGSTPSSATHSNKASAGAHPRPPLPAAKAQFRPPPPKGAK